MKTHFAGLSLLLITAVAVDAHAAPRTPLKPALHPRIITLTRGATKIGVASFTLLQPQVKRALATRPIAKGKVELSVSGAANQALAMAWMKELVSGKLVPAAVTLVVAQDGKTLESYLFKAAFPYRYTPPTQANPTGPAALGFAHSGGTFSSGPPAAH